MSNNKHKYILRPFLSITPTETIDNDFIKRFLSLQSSKIILSKTIQQINEEFAKLLYECVYYYEETLVEEQNKFYQQIKEKIIQLKENIEENEWAKEHHVFIDEEDDQQQLNINKSLDINQSQLDELFENLETKFPLIGDNSTFHNVLDDLKQIILSANQFKVKILELLNKTMPVNNLTIENKDLDNLLFQNMNHFNNYNTFNHLIGLIKDEDELLKYAKEITLNILNKLELWQSINEQQTISPSKHLIVDTNLYDFVLNRYKSLYVDIYRHVVDSFRSVVFMIITVTNKYTNKTKIVYIKSTNDIKELFIGKESNSLLEIYGKLLGTKYDDNIKKVHFLTIDRNEHEPIEIVDDSINILKQIEEYLLINYTPELNNNIPKNLQFNLDLDKSIIEVLH